MRKTTIYALMAFASALLLSTGIAHSAKIRVVNGDLQTALDDASSGDVIVADPNFQIVAGVAEGGTAFALDKDDITIEGLNGKLAPRAIGTAFLHVTGDNFTIRDFKLDGNSSKMKKSSRISLLIINGNNPLVEDGVVRDSWRNGVEIVPNGANITSGVVRNLEGHNVDRDVVSLDSAGSVSGFVSGMHVHDIRGFSSRKRGAVEVSDGVLNSIVENVYAEDCVYAVDIQDHDEATHSNGGIVLRNISAKNCSHIVRGLQTEEHVEHNDILVENISGSGWAVRRKQEPSPLAIHHVDNLKLSNVDYDGDLKVILFQTESFQVDRVYEDIKVLGSRASMELASTDHGAIVQPVGTNYGVQSLEIGSEHRLKSTDTGSGGVRTCTLTLLDAHDNSAGAGAEVLYVDTLTIWDGSTLNLNGKTVYYNTLDNSGRVELNGGTLRQIGASQNELPRANAGPDQTLADNDGDGFTLVTLDGSASTDADGSIVSYSWSEDGTVIANGVNATVELPIGVHEIVLTVTDNSDGTSTDTVSLMVLEPDVESGEWTDICFDDFETGLENWAARGANTKHYTGGEQAHQGIGAANIQGRRNTSKLELVPRVQAATNGYTSIRIDFWFRAVGMDNSREGFRLQIHDGSGWVSVGTYLNTSDFDNNVFYNKSVEVDSDSISFVDGMRIRFVCNANHVSDDVYLDEIRVSVK